MTKCNDLTDKYLKLDCDFSPNLDFLNGEFDNYRILGLQGGARSLKSASVNRFLVDRMIKKSKYNVLYLVNNKTKMPKLMMQDVELQIKDMGLFDKFTFNTSGLYIECKESRITFSSYESLNMIHNYYFKQFDIIVLCELECCDLFINKVDDIISIGKKILAPYNPTKKNSTINNLLSMDYCALIRTNYKHNKFLNSMQRKEIEALKHESLSLYTTLGLGEFYYGS